MPEPAPTPAAAAAAAPAIRPPQADETQPEAATAVGRQSPTPSTATAGRLPSVGGIAREERRGGTGPEVPVAVTAAAPTTAAAEAREAAAAAAEARAAAAFAARANAGTPRPASPVPVGVRGTPVMVQAGGGLLVGVAPGEGAR